MRKWVIKNYKFQNKFRITPTCITENLSVSSDLFKMTLKHYNMGLCFIMYGLAYISRKSFNSLIPKIEEEVGISTQFIGNVSLYSHISYVISKVFGNIVSDYCDAKQSMILYLTMSFISHIFIYTKITHECTALLVYLSLNSLSIGALWSSVRTLIFNWTNKSERGMYTALMTNSTLIGSFIITFLLHFKFLLFSQIFLIYTSLILVNIVVAYLIQSEPKNKENEENNDEKESQSSQTGIKPNYYILCILLIGHSFIHFLKTIWSDWLSSLLFNYYNFNSIEISSLILSFDIGNIVGGIFAGYISDLKSYSKNRSVIVLYYCIIGFIHSLFYQYINNNSHLFYIIMFMLFISGFSLGGPFCLGGLVISEFDVKNKGKISALASIAELSLSPFSIVVNKYIQSYGWNTLLIVYTLLFTVIFSFFIPYVVIVNNSLKIKKD